MKSQIFRTFAFNPSILTTSSSKIINTNHHKSLIRDLSTINQTNVNINDDFVPKHSRATDSELQKMSSFIRCHDKILVITGAGISTESGIPDYRSEEVGLFARSNHKPIQYQDFLKSELTRQRYWSRNYLGWKRWSSIEPNINHLILADWEITHGKKGGKVLYVVTQNVDTLHSKAGSERVIELHGNGHIVKCLNCTFKTSRYHVQEILNQLNAELISCYNQDNHDSNSKTLNQLRPDGDIEIQNEFTSRFKSPLCPSCTHGILKPDVVFFGDNVPQFRVEHVHKLVKECDSMLVIGSSMTVYSGYRFALAAHENGKDIAVINIGKTRIDDLASLKINCRAGHVLPQLARTIH